MPENCFLFTQHNFQPIYIIPVAMALISILIDDIPLTSHHSLRPRLRPRCGDTIDNLSMDGAEKIDAREPRDSPPPPFVDLERVTARLVMVPVLALIHYLCVAVSLYGSYPWDKVTR